MRERTIRHGAGEAGDADVDQTRGDLQPRRSNATERFVPLSPRDEPRERAECAENRDLNQLDSDLMLVAARPEHALGNEHDEGEAPPSDLKSEPRARKRVCSKRATGIARNARCCSVRFGGRAG